MVSLENEHQEINAGLSHVGVEGFYLDPFWVVRLVGSIGLEPRTFIMLSLRSYY